MQKWSKRIASDDKKDAVRQKVTDVAALINQLVTAKNPQ